MSPSDSVNILVCVGVVDCVLPVVGFGFHHRLQEFPSFQADILTLFQQPVVAIQRLFWIHQQMTSAPIASMSQTRTSDNPQTEGDSSETNGSALGNNPDILFLGGIQESQKSIRRPYVSISSSGGPDTMPRAEIRRLPYEILSHIVQDLSLETIFDLSQSCRYFQYLVREVNLCKMLVKVNWYRSNCLTLANI